MIFYALNIVQGIQMRSALPRLLLWQVMLGDVSLVMQFAGKSGMNPMEVVECFQETFWKEITPGEYNRLLTLLIEKAVVWDNKLEIEFKTAGIKSLMEGFKND